MRAFPEHVFREGDVRGLVPAELTEPFAETLGCAFASLLLEKHPAARSFALGRDHRLSSNDLARAFSRGARSFGLDAIDLGVVPTPLTYFAAHLLPVDGLCMITGSHNPPAYNGFKLGLGKSTLAGAEVRALGERARAFHEEKLAPPTNVRAGRETPFAIIDLYISIIIQTIGMPTIKDPARKLKVVCDAGNGTGGLVGPKLLRALGHEVIELFCEVDGSFPNHHPDPSIEANLRDLQARVRQEKADLGVAWDGDSDRLGAVDERGQILWGDQLLLLFSRELLSETARAKHQVAIVAEVKCSQTLFDDIALRGGRAIMWKAGHSHIKAKMKEARAQLAGEMSGHLFFADRWYGFDDGIYAAARLLNLLAKSGRNLSALLDDLPKTYASPEIRVPFTEHKKARAIELATERLRAFGETIEIDGVRVNIEGAWGLVRASGTQPLLVLRWEATSEEAFERIRKLIEETVQKIRDELGG